MGIVGRSSSWTRVLPARRPPLVQHPEGAMPAGGLCTMARPKDPARIEQRWEFVRTPGGLRAPGPQTSRLDVYTVNEGILSTPSAEEKRGLGAAYQRRPARAHPPRARQHAHAAVFESLPQNGKMNVMERSFQYNDPWRRFYSICSFSPVSLRGLRWGLNALLTGLCSHSGPRLRNLQRESVCRGLQTEFPRGVMGSGRVYLTIRT